MKPVLQALVLADHVYEDRSTGKKVIAGTFNRYHVARRPTDPQEANKPRRIPGGGQAGSPYTYISLTDILGTVPLRLRFVDLADANVLLQTEFSVSCDDRLRTVELVIPLPALPLPHPGVYVLELLSGEDPLGSLRITVQMHEEAPPGAPPPGSSPPTAPPSNSG